MFSPNLFLSKLSQYGGVDKTNMFVVNIEPYTNSDVESFPDLRFFCKTAQIPGIDFSTNDYKPQGYGMGINLPTGVSNSGFSSIFILDSNNHVLSYFHRWAQKVLNYDASRGMLSSTDGKLPYEIGYLRGEKGYGATLTITKFNPYDAEMTYEAVLHDVYPMAVGSVSMNWEDQNSFSTLPVSFAYSSISFSGSTPGTTNGYLNRAKGDIQYLTGLRRKGQTINDFVNENTFR